MAKKSTTRKKASKTTKKKTTAKPKATSGRKSASKKLVTAAGRKATKKTAKKATTRSASTRAAATGKKPSSTTDANNTPVAHPVEPVLPKTKLSEEDLKEFTTLLLAKRSELVGDVNHLRSEALHEGEEGVQTSAVPIHMADISSDRWEQEFNLVLMESEQKLLREIDAALDRIITRAYGVCEGTGKTITKRRLRAKPWARYCIDYARQKELGLVR